jgi:hypothetical protein
MEYNSGRTSGIEAIGILSAVLLGVGLLPPLLESVYAGGQNVSFSKSRFNLIMLT